MRIDKYLSNANFGSRSEIKKMIKQNMIELNGKIIKNGKEQIDLTKDIVKVNGKKISLETKRYLMLNKPQGVISATKDSSQPTVIDLISSKDKIKDLAPVGRLDKDTTGLLLLTNDGKLAHELLAPKKHVIKTYHALVSGIVDDSLIEHFKNGITLKDGTNFKPAKLKILSINKENNTSKVSISISEGKYHQIKRMFKANQMTVLTLHRLSMGSLFLDNSLQPGAYRRLSSQEINILKNKK